MITRLVDTHPSSLGKLWGGWGRLFLVLFAFLQIPITCRNEYSLICIHVCIRRSILSHCVRWEFYTFCALARKSRRRRKSRRIISRSFFLALSRMAARRRSEVNLYFRSEKPSALLYQTKLKNINVHRREGQVDYTLFWSPLVVRIFRIAWCTEANNLS